MVGIDTRGSSRVISIVGLFALLFAIVAPALLTLRSAEAAVPSVVIVYAPAGFVPGTAVVNTASGVTFRVIVDIDDGDAPYPASPDAGQTNETNVQMTTTAGTFTDSGSTSVIIPCAIDGNATVAAMNVDPDAGGPGTAVTITDPTFLGGIAVENEGESDTDGLTGDGVVSPGEVGDNGCLAVDAYIFVPSNVSGTAAVAASAQNGGAASSTTVVITPFSGATATLSVTNVEGSRYIAPGITGRFTSPNDAAGVTATARDAGGNAVVGASILWTTSNGTVATAGGPGAGTDGTCPGTTNNAAELTGATGSSTVSFCARPGNALGDATITGQETTSGRSGTVTVTFVGPPSKLVMTTEFIAATGGSSALESSQAAAGAAVAIRVTVTCTDADNRPCADGTGVAGAASGAGTAVGASTAMTAGKSTFIVTTNSEQNASVAISASVGTVDGGLVSDARTVNLRAAQTVTPTPGPGTVTPTPAPTGCTVTPNSPYQAGLNAVVVQAACTSASAASVIATSSGRTVLVIFVLAGGNWLYFLPAFPAINGGLTNFPGPLASAIVTIQ